MDIKFLDSHLREHLETNAKPQDIARVISLTSASIERVEKIGSDFIYSAEITTNRPDMASVRGIAREASTVLPQFGFGAKLSPLNLKTPKIELAKPLSISIVNDAKLVYRICAIVMEIELKDSPKYIKERLEAAGIRSINNLIDITNYVMLEMGHPTHVFDYDRLTTKKLVIRESKKGEKITTLDKKEHILSGGDIVADNGKGEIVDLLGVMGTLNSVVTQDTKRALFFIDNNDPWRIRKTSMGLGIRTEAASLNEKGVDPELTYDSLLRGVELYKKFANAKIASEVIDIYKVKIKPKTIKIAAEKISSLIGVNISQKKSSEILKSLGFKVTEQGDILSVIPPSSREKDVTLEEDVVEEIARVYGYHNIPTLLPVFERHQYYHQDKNPFFWETKIKDTLKYWGFTEIYTYSMVSEKELDKPLDQIVTIKNPLDLDHVHMRTNITKSIELVLDENKTMEDIKIFELSNVYIKQNKDLPRETLNLALLIKGKFDGRKADYFTAKGIFEQLAVSFGVKGITYEEYLEDGFGAYINLFDFELGEIIVRKDYVTMEINFDTFRKYANSKKTYNPLPKYPPIIEDLALNIESQIKTGDIIELIKKQSQLIYEVTLFDSFENTRTFHIVYQDKNKNLTNIDVEKIRKKILQSLSSKFSAKLKV